MLCDIYDMLFCLSLRIDIIKLMDVMFKKTMHDHTKIFQLWDEVTVKEPPSLYSVFQGPKLFAEAESRQTNAIHQEIT